MAQEENPRAVAWSNLADFLALKRNTALLLVALVLAGTGERLWLVFAPKYLQTLGAGILIIGVFDALQTLLGALYAYPGGWLTDRLGQRLSLSLFSGHYGGVTAQQYGVLVAIEMATAMLCYIPVAHLADRHGRRPFVLITFLFFTLFPLSLLWARSFSGLVVAFIMRGLKEFGEPARKALIIAEARPELRARTYGAYYLIRDCVVTTGAFLGAWLWSLGPQINFLGAAIFGAAGTVWFWFFIFRRAPIPDS